MIINRRTTLGVLTAGALTAAGATATTPASAATACSFNATTHDVTVTVDGTAASIARSGDLITVDGAGCGAATVTTTDSIHVYGSDTQNETVELAPNLGPGFTAESNGVSEIEVFLDLKGLTNPHVWQTVTVHGSDADDRISVGGRDTNVNGDNDADLILADTHEVPMWVVHAGGGDDVISGQGGHGTGTPEAVTFSAHGDAGRDRLIGTPYGWDQFDGGPGDDYIDGAAGGVDTVSYRGVKSRVRVDLSTGTAVGANSGHDILRRIEDVHGTDFGDVIVGSYQANRLWGWGGVDTIRGGGSDDLMTGGAQPDHVDGGRGRDTISYGDEPGAVEVDLRSQTALAPAGDEVFQGIEGASGSNYGDTLIGDDSPNNLGGAGGVDAVIGLGGGDVITGGIGNDALSGGAGDDTIYPDLADYPLQGNDVVHGGSGVDTLNYANFVFAPTAPGGVRVDLAAGTVTGAAGTDSVTGFENVVGSPGNDTLLGDAGDNDLTGDGGIDSCTQAGGAGSVICETTN